MGDLIKVLDPNYEPKNRHERILRWLGNLNALSDTGICDARLGDTELEAMAHMLEKSLPPESTVPPFDKSPDPILLSKNDATKMLAEELERDVSDEEADSFWKWLCNDLGQWLMDNLNSWTRR
jgi:hypothetical protein